MGRMFLVLLLFVPGVAYAQEWTSTDVGDVGASGSATQEGDTWTVRGAGDDIWGTQDAFQFLHRTVNASGFIVARVSDFQGVNAFAKAGVIVRASADADAAAAILDLKAGGGIEFMARASSGAAMQYVDGAGASAPVWLRLGWTAGQVTAWTSADGMQWTVLCSTSLALAASPQAGVAVTSHDHTQIATASIDHLAVGVQRIDWTPHAIAASAGSADEQNGTWTITGGGSDIWGTADSFEYVSRAVSGTNLHLVARVDDLQNTHPFAKAGVMVRAALDANAAAVLIDVTPGGQIEFMARTGAGAEMQYLGGAAATQPVWLQLAWTGDVGQSAQVVASFSNDGVTWSPLGSPVLLTLPDTYQAGVAVTSHDTSRTTTAHVDGLSLLPIAMGSTHVGVTPIAGNAVLDVSSGGVMLTVEAAGSDIWGASDDFQFVDLGAATGSHVALVYRVASLDNVNAFAKAGLMFRDGTGASAASVIVDAKPDGGVEFMARLCAGCSITYLGGASIVFPSFLSLIRDGATFTASVFTQDQTDGRTIGSVTVPMNNPMPGFAVTSHDPQRIVSAVFDNPAR